MKYTLNDFPNASYTFDPVAKTISLVGFGFQLKLSNFWAIINATESVVINRIDDNLLNIDNIDGNNVVYLSQELDISNMDSSNELVFIFDLPQVATKVVNQDGTDITQNLEAIVDSILELSDRLGFLPAVRGSLNDLRVTLLGGTTAVTGTLAGVTLVTTVGNQTSMGGYNAAPIVGSLQNMVVAQAITANISF